MMRASPITVEEMSPDELHQLPHRTAEAIAQNERWGAHNYHPLPVVVERAEGVWVHDVDGASYIDMLSAYSALNFGHRHPRLLQAAKDQLSRVTLTSRAFYNDQLGPFSEALAQLCRMEAVLPMNTGAEAVETAIKLARRWAYDKKGVAADKAKIIVCSGNFHGRTTTIVSFSTDETARTGFGPFTPGFEVVPYGNIDALRNAIDENTAAFLIEPVQGEAGVIIPPAGFLQRARQVCTDNNVLFIADEVQSGLGRTGKTFACDHENVQPDIFVLGKALGGAIVPLSAVVSRWDIMEVIHPGEHGSTFGGNPLACAIGREVVAMLEDGSLQSHAAKMGTRLKAGLEAANLANVKEVRQIGLWLGIELVPSLPARAVTEALIASGVLCKETHEVTVRLAPPLIISDNEVELALERLIRVLSR
jgi:ornithine--oxo-acid transaminase